MKKMMKHLLAALLCVSASHATTHTNKTFLMPRAPLRDKAMELSTWHTQINKKGDGLFGGSLQATGFYQSSTNQADTGRYFGAESATTTKDNTIEVVQAAAANDLFNTNIYHSAGNTSSDVAFAGTMRLNPRRDIWGVRFDYYQDFDKILNGLFFKASTVVAGVHTSMHETLENSTPIASGDNAGKTVADFFAGNLSQGLGVNQQAALAYAKIDKGHHTTDLADIDLNLGYNFVNKKNWHLGLAFTLMIPTGNTPRGEFVFEPVSGHGGSWAVGGILDSAFTLWKSDNKNKNLSLSLAVDYRFLFENTQRRTLGLIQGGEVTPHGQYFLMGKNGVSGLFPAANITTRDVEVEPGSQVEAIAALAFNCCNWTFDIGYNLYYQDREAVKVKSWQEETYAVAHNDYQAVVNNLPVAFSVTNDSVLGTAVSITDLNTKGAETPSQLSHKLYGGIGYAFNHWSNPLMFGLGGGFEWKDSNAILEQWSLWGKTGISF